MKLSEAIDKLKEKENEIIKLQLDFSKYLYRILLAANKMEHGQSFLKKPHFKGKIGGVEDGHLYAVTEQGRHLKVVGDGYKTWDDLKK